MNGYRTKRALRRNPLKVRLKSAKRFLRLLDDASQTIRLRSGLVTLQPSEDVGEHITDGKEEVIIVLRGKGSVSCSGHRDFKLKAGELLYIPPGIKHNVTNAGKGALSYVYVVTPVAIG